MSPSHTSFIPPQDSNKLTTCHNINPQHNIDILLFLLLRKHTSSQSNRHDENTALQTAPQENNRFLGKAEEESKFPTVYNITTSDRY